MLAVCMQGEGESLSFFLRLALLCVVLLRQFKILLGRWIGGSMELICGTLFVGIPLCALAAFLESWFSKNNVVLLSCSVFKTVLIVCFCFHGHRINIDLKIEQHSKTTLILKNQFSSN